MSDALSSLKPIAWHHGVSVVITQKKPASMSLRTACCVILMPVTNYLVYVLSITRSMPQFYRRAFYHRELEAHAEGRRDRDKRADILIKAPTNLYLQFQNVSSVFPPGHLRLDRTGILSQLQLSGIDPP